MAGIVGYGAYIPRNRITTEEIAKQWGKDPAAIKRGLLLEEKSVPGPDEDTITISVAAARDAIARARIDPQRIGAVYIGSFDGKVYALDGATGKQKWALSTGPIYASSPAIAADGTIYVGSSNGYLYAIGP